MSQTQQMTMAGMGGPVGGGVAQPQQMNAGTPTNSGNGNNSDEIKRLNTYIYDYLLRNSYYEAARSLISDSSPSVKPLVKESPDSRANGADDGIDGDSKDGLKGRPSDLQAPNLPNVETAFLQDWWCQFWEIYHSQRNRGRPNSTAYLQAQRQLKMARNAGMDPNMQNMRQFNGQMPMAGMNGMQQGDLRKAMQGKLMNPSNLVAMRQAQGNQMQGQEMQRTSSQMEGPRSGSPSGDDPSPKRQRLDGGGNMQQMVQGRPGQPGNQVGPTPDSQAFPTDSAAERQTREILLQHNIAPQSIPALTFEALSQQPANVQHKSVGEYSKSLSNSMQVALNHANANNVNKNMPPNAAAAMGPGAQGSPMSQGLDGAPGDFYAANNGQIRMPPGQAQAAAGGGQNGNHALQDYQMQLMLLEQQNKKRLLMARQEQDSMAHPGQPGGMNGQFPQGMSPQGGRAGPSPGPGDMARNTPKMGTSPGNMQGRSSPGPMDPNNMPQAAMRQLMMNGQMRPPSSHPMNPQQAQMEMFARGPPGGMMPNGTFPGQQPPLGMPGQPGQPGQPPNMTPRQGNPAMPPPPAPPAGNPSGTQPSSPAQPPAPPTPNQTNKPKPGGKKETKASKAAANKKGGNTGATPASESEQPPTPTPATPITPMHTASFNQKQNQQMPNGQGPHQQNQASQQPQGGTNAVQPPAGPDMGSNEFMGGEFTGMDFNEGNGSDLLADFDFDTFLTDGAADPLNFGFDANVAFGEIEAGPDAMGQ